MGIIAMKKMVWSVSVFMVLLATGTTAQVESFMVDSANKHYMEGEYRQAIQLYQQVLNKGIEAPGIYYNLGNAYYKTHQLAPAILNYERALLRNPSNEDIQYNLKLARSQIPDKIEKIPEFFINQWVKNLIDTFSSDTWAVISMIAFALFLVLFSLYLYSQRIQVKKSSFWISMLAVAIAIASFTFSYKQKQEVMNSKQAIVFASKVTVKSSPAESGTDLFVIHEGAKVFIADQMSEWYEIRLADGSQGWLRKKTVEAI